MRGMAYYGYCSAKSKSVAQQKTEIATSHTPPEAIDRHKGRDIYADHPNLDIISKIVGDFNYDTTSVAPEVSK